MARRAVALGLWAMAAAHVGEALVVRSRNGAVEVLGPDPATDLATDLATEAAPGTSGTPGTDDWVQYVAGPPLPGAVVARVAAHADRLGLDVVDVVPVLEAEEALSLLRLVDPAALPRQVLASPGGAHRALLARRVVVDRLDDPPPAGQRTVELDVVALASVTKALQLVAPRRAGLVAAPELEGEARSADQRFALLHERLKWTKPYGDAVRIVSRSQGVHLAAMAAGTAVAPRSGLVAWLTWAAQPAIAFGGTPAGVRPRRVLATSLRRPIDGVAGWWALMAAGRRRAEAAPPAPIYRSRPAPDELVEPERGDCPWCGRDTLTERLRTTDLLQHKEGEFRLDRCRSCGHIFQNPRLAPAGLDYYYADFYDGDGGEFMDRLFGAAVEDAHQQLASLDEHDVRPRSWLDVGTGHGHFCLLARDHWPDARIDGLDLSAGVRQAERRGWVDHGYQAMFPDAVDMLAGRYEGVSMHHYLEHTTDPLVELDAVAKVLESGGWLQIELPDAESRWARLLGRYWLPWLQPQHLHLISLGNLIEALEARGFEIEKVERDINAPYQLLAAAFLAVEDRLPSPHYPWRPPSSRAYRFGRATALGALMPVFLTAGIADLVAFSTRDRDAPGVAFRVLARKR